MACLLNHRFEVERYRQSREWDPIVGVSFTGLFDFFVHAFGALVGVVGLVARH